jgi:alanyl aminopeptidase
MSRVVLVGALVLAACAACAPRPAPKPAAAPAGATGSPVATPAAAPAAPGLRLPDTVVPTAYRLRIEADPAQEAFTGHVDIDVRFTAAVDHVWLHAQELTITAPAITVGGARQGLTALTAAGHDTVGFALTAPAPAGTATLHLDFAGKAPAEAMSGLFREQEGGRWYMYTQLESIFARRVFPSIDEPRHKVPWTITLVAPAGQVALSNMPAEREVALPDGRREVTFATTPPLPSYLVAFAIGPFEMVDVGPVGRNKVPARIVTLAGKTAEARWAKEATPKLVAALEDYFDMPLPYAKLDQIVVPRFFGAMENPGLITYAASILVASPAQETAEFRRGFIAIGGHELAHQWFGNLVTLAWWDDTWLNESFATWMADKIGKQLDPGWDVAIRHVDEANHAMTADVSKTAAPLRRPIVAQADIEGAFDAIAYEKGGAVLSMFERWIGEDHFRAGVRAYIARHAGGTATSRDFLEALAAVSTPDTLRGFTAFLEQVGVPLVRVKLVCDGAPTVHLTQERLAVAGTGAVGSWPLPVCVRYPVSAARTAKVVERCQLLDAASATIALAEATACPAWVNGNAGAVGYYRVGYEGDLGDRLIKALDRQAPAERIALAADTAALTELGHRDAGAGLALARALLTRKDEHSALAAVRLLAASRDLVDAAHRPAWQRYVRASLGARARAVGFAPVAASTTTAARDARAALLALVAIHAEEPALIADARRRAEAWLDGKGGIAVEDLGIVMSAAGRAADAALFDRLERAARASQEQRERIALLAGLGNVRDPALSLRALRLLVDGPFDITESGVLIGGAFGQPALEPQAWAFFKDNYATISARVPPFARGYLVFVASNFCTEAQRKDAESFFTPHAAGVANGTRMLAQSLESIDRCIANRARSADAVERSFGAVR